MVKPGTAPPITAAIDAARLSFASDGSTENAEAGRYLRTTLRAPLVRTIGNVDTILISPDGSLSRLPFAALPVRKPGTGLIEDHRLALIPVPQLILTLLNDQSRRQPPQDLPLLGAVDCDNASAEDVDVPQPVGRRKPGDVQSEYALALRSIHGGSGSGVWIRQAGELNL